MTKIILRPVIASDLPILFAQQLEPEAVAMAEYPAKDKGEFMRHWEGILKNKSILARTIIYKEKIAGHMISWKEKYEQQVGYWLGREYWGKGIASAALAEFLDQIKIRPLYAHVAIHNIASRRVLEKCGFVLHEESRKEYVLKLNSDS